MAEFPSLPLWTDAYMADTMDLTAEEHGVYLLLLMISWRRPNCDLPNDLPGLKRLLSGAASDMHGNRFNRVVPTILNRFFVLDEAGFYTQKKLRKERDFLRKKGRKASENVQKRWVRHRENNGLADTAVILPTPTPTPTPIEDTPLSPPQGGQNTKGAIANGRRQKRPSLRQSFFQAVDHIQGRSQQAEWDEGSDEDGGGYPVLLPGHR